MQPLVAGTQTESAIPKLPATENVLKGKVICGICGGKMQRKKGSQSARSNHLDVYEYLKYLLTEMPNNDHVLRPEILDDYLPWSEELPDECRLATK